jgi:hypothetical protein
MQVVEGYVASRTCRNEGVTCKYIYTLTGILTHGLLDLVRDHQLSFITILVGNQIDALRAGRFVSR